MKRLSCRSHRASRLTRHRQFVAGGEQRHPRATPHLPTGAAPTDAARPIACGVKPRAAARAPPHRAERPRRACESRWSDLRAPMRTRTAELAVAVGAIALAQLLHHHRVGARRDLRARENPRCAACQQRLRRPDRPECVAMTGSTVPSAHVGHAHRVSRPSRCCLRAGTPSAERSTLGQHSLQRIEGRDSPRSVVAGPVRPRSASATASSRLNIAPGQTLRFRVVMFMSRASAKGELCQAVDIGVLEAPSPVRPQAASWVAINALTRCASAGSTVQRRGWSSSPSARQAAAACQWPRAIRN